MKAYNSKIGQTVLNGQIHTARYMFKTNIFINE